MWVTLGGGIFFSSENAVKELITSGFGPLEEAPLDKLSDEVERWQRFACALLGYDPSEELETSLLSP
jgi:hypothetical protein